MSMDKKMDRRTFLVDGAKATVALAGLSLAPGLLPVPARAADASPDISVVTGTDYYKATIQAVEQLGGMGRFVSKGDNVGLLANIFSKKPGTYTRPDVVLAVACLCYEAGAKQVYCMKNESKKFWRRSRTSEQHQDLIARLKPDGTDHKTIQIPSAKVLKEASILEGTFKHDKLINIPIIKDHSGVHMTCTLKNMMGLSSFGTNVKFHLGPNYVQTFIKEFGDFFSDLDHFSQSVADLNKVRKADLCVVDATEFITTNGPSGPGKMSRPNQIVAGTDPVAIDALCCSYLDLMPEEIGMIQKAHQDGLGQVNLEKMTISRTTM
ncbi:DUF362 domain-containing protein [Thermodesulfobacteriota bacterium]